MFRTTDFSSLHQGTTTHSIDCFEIIFTTTIRHLFLSVTVVSVCQLWLFYGKFTINIFYVSIWTKLSGISQQKFSLCHHVVWCLTIVYYQGLCVSGVAVAEDDRDDSTHIDDTIMTRRRKWLPSSGFRSGIGGEKPAACVAAQLTQNFLKYFLVQNISWKF